MTNEKAIADHWAKGDVYARIVSALGGMSKSLDAVTLEDLAPDIAYAVRLAREHGLEIAVRGGGPCYCRSVQTSLERHR